GEVVRHRVNPVPFRHSPNLDPRRRDVNAFAGGCGLPPGSVQTDRKDGLGFKGLKPGLGDDQGRDAEDVSCAPPTPPFCSPRPPPWPSPPPLRPRRRRACGPMTTSPSPAPTRPWARTSTRRGWTAF